MGDFISIEDTKKPVIVKKRLHDIRTRYPMSNTEFEKLSKTIFNLKNYWDKRLDCNLYEILQYLVRGRSNNPEPFHNIYIKIQENIFPVFFIYIENILS